jgi:hypothetical protein
MMKKAKTQSRARKKSVNRKGAVAKPAKAKAFNFGQIKKKKFVLSARLKAYATTHTY